MGLAFGLDSAGALGRVKLSARIDLALETGSQAGPRRRRGRRTVIGLCPPFICSDPAAQACLS